VDRLCGGRAGEGGGPRAATIAGIKNDSEAAIRENTCRALERDCEINSMYSNFERYTRIVSM
jgi:hypothetical protein